MINPFRFQFVPCLATLVLAMPAPAQEADGEADEEEDRRTIAELTENSDRHDGLFTLYRDRETGETHLAVTPEQLDREYIYVSVSTDGVVEGGTFRGNYRENRVLSVRRHFDRIEIRAENSAFHFDPDSPLSRAAGANISPGLLASQPILAEDEDTGAMLIAADDLFASETLSQIKPSPNPDGDDRNRFELGSLSGEKSKITAIRNYPLNTDIHVEFVYEDSAPAVAGDDEVTDSRYVSIHLQHSLIAMPGNAYRPRLTDHRMGYFAEQVTDLTDDSVTPHRDLVQRWHLVPRDPGRGPVRAGGTYRLVDREYDSDGVPGGHRRGRACLEPVVRENRLQRRLGSARATRRRGLGCRRHPLQCASLDILAESAVLRLRTVVHESAHRPDHRRRHHARIFRRDPASALSADSRQLGLLAGSRALRARLLFHRPRIAPEPGFRSAGRGRPADGPGGRRAADPRVSGRSDVARGGPHAGFRTQLRRLHHAVARRDPRSGSGRGAWSVGVGDGLYGYPYRHRRTRANRVLHHQTGAV